MAIVVDQVDVETVDTRGADVTASDTRPTAAPAAGHGSNLFRAAARSGAARTPLDGLTDAARRTPRHQCQADHPPGWTGAAVAHREHRTPADARGGRRPVQPGARHLRCPVVRRRSGRLWRNRRKSARAGCRDQGVHGRDRRAAEVFDGHVTALEAEVGPSTAPLFTLLAEDRLFKARKTRRSRTFDEVTPADIVRTIAGDHGLTPEVRDGLDAPTGTWSQMNESDLAFLRRILDRFDADAQAVAGALQAGPRARDPRTTVILRLGEALVRARMTADLADQADGSAGRRLRSGHRRTGGRDGDGRGDGPRQRARRTGAAARAFR